MPDPFIGEIRLYPYDFAPAGWLLCDGALLDISEYTALFTLLGTVYGGDGQDNFAIPNLLGATAIGTGQGPGLSGYFLGDVGGSETVTLLESEMPVHNHSARASTAQGVTNDVLSTSIPGTVARAPNAKLYQLTVTGLVAMGAASEVGGDQPHNNLMPYLALHFFIAIEGTFPAQP